jgi:hypothetical protein
MSTPVRLAAFLTALCAVFALAALAGGAVGPAPQEDAAAMEHEADAHAAPTARSAEHDAREGDAHGGHAAEPAAADAPLPGLAVAAGGHRLDVERTRLTPGTRELRFRILDDEGAAVTRFDVAHTKRLHLIVVRRDGAHFVHRHPVMAADGTWSVRVRLPEPGAYRLFADFTRGGEQQTLGADLLVAGDFTPRAFPPPSSEAVSDGGLRVTLRSAPLVAGAAAPVAFTVRDGDRSVDAELEPHLGARGHLVALRAGDLAYLHTHPDGDALRFEASWPSAGTYRLWVQFRHRGRVHTAAFTQEVGS